jgi:hypothetical protein
MPTDWTTLRRRAQQGCGRLAIARSREHRLPRLPAVCELAYLNSSSQPARSRARIANARSEGGQQFDVAAVGEREKSCVEGHQAHATAAGERQQVCVCHQRTP